MYELIDKLSIWMPYYLLVFLRLSAMVTTMPILGYATVNARIRIMLAFILTIIIAPLLGSHTMVEITSVLQLFVLGMKEIFIGLIIGFGARLIFEGFSMAGAFIGLQMGMAIMNVFDPTQQQQQPIISQFWLFIMIIFFLVTNSHYFLIETLYQNFSIIHLTKGEFTPQLGQTIIQGGSLIYEMALKYAAPAMIFLLIVDISLSFVARVMPQMNIFFVSLPLKISVGIIVLIISLRIFQVLFSYIYNELEGYVYSVIKTI